MAVDDLQKKQDLYPLTNIVVANMTGAGTFTTSGLLIAGLNNPILLNIASLTVLVGISEY